MNSFLNHKKLLLFTSICILWSSHHLVFAANDLADSARRAAEVHDAVNAERMNLKKTGFVRWFDESFLHLKLELRELTQYQFMSDSTVSAETSYEEILPLIEALIKYRKIVTNDLRDVPLEEGFKCRNEFVDTSINYINSYSQIKRFHLCYSEPTTYVGRTDGVLLMMQSILPQEQDPLDFAVKQGIISLQYNEEQVRYQKINHAELATISSRIMDYIWKNRHNLEPYQKIEQWYDPYFEIMDNGPVNFMYSLSMGPSSAVQMWEIYKLLPDLLRYRTTEYKHRWNDTYICGEQDFVFTNDVYSIDVYLGTVSKDCIQLIRYHELTRQEGVELLLNVIFREIVNKEAFALQNGFFSDSYLEGENKNKIMNHAELAKLIAKIILFLEQEDQFVPPSIDSIEEVSPNIGKIGKKYDEFTLQIMQKMNQPDITLSDKATLTCEFASFMAEAQQFKAAFQLLNNEELKQFYSDQCLQDLLHITKSLSDLNTHKFYSENYKYYEHMENSPNILIDLMYSGFNEEAVKQYIIDHGNTLSNYIAYYYLVELRNTVRPESEDGTINTLYEIIKNTDSDSSHSLKSKGIILFNNGEIDKSLETVLQALELEKNYSIYHSIAYVYAYKCMEEESMKYVELAKQYTNNIAIIDFLIETVEKEHTKCESSNPWNLMH